MKYKHHHDHLRTAGLHSKSGRPESTNSADRADSTGGGSDDPPHEVEIPPPVGKDPGQLELRQSPEQSKAFLNPIQSFWPTSPA